MERAKNLGIKSYAFELKEFDNKIAYEQAIIDLLKKYAIDLVCLAGYMKIVGPTLLAAYQGRIINIHPALLPSFRGLHAQRQAIEAGVKVAGCTVHFVGTGLDDGPIITQVAVPVYDHDTEDTLSARILAEEHPAYVRAVKAYCEDKLHIAGHTVTGMHEEE